VERNVLGSIDQNESEMTEIVVEIGVGVGVDVEVDADVDESVIEDDPGGIQSQREDGDIGRSYWKQRKKQNCHESFEYCPSRGPSQDQVHRNLIHLDPLKGGTGCHFDNLIL